MTSPAGLWSAGVDGDPDNLNAGLIQRVAFASLPTKTGLQGMCAIVSDGVGGNGGPEAVYVRLDSSATWTLVGTLKGSVGVRCTDASTQSISHNTVTAVNFDQEDFDDDGFHDTVTNNTRLTVPTGMGGKYLIHGGFQMDVGPDDVVNATIRLNGSTTLTQQSWGPGITSNQFAQAGSLMTIYDLSAADYVELTARLDESAAGSIDIDSATQHFGMWKLD